MDFPDIESNAFSWGWRDNTQTFTSSLNNAVQHASMPGGQWHGTLTFSNRDTLIDDIATFKAFLMRVGGVAGRFRLSPPDLNQRGTMLGSGVVASLGADRQKLQTSGWQANQPLLFKAGDYFEVNGQLFMVVEDAASNASGNAELVFRPAIRKNPSIGAQILVQNPSVLCMLENKDQVQWQVNTGPLIHALSLSVVEDVT